MKGGLEQCLCNPCSRKMGKGRRGAGAQLGSCSHALSPSLSHPLSPPGLVGTSDYQQTPALSWLSCAGARAFNLCRIPSHPIPIPHSPAPGGTLHSVFQSLRNVNNSAAGSSEFPGSRARCPGPADPSPLPTGLGRCAWHVAVPPGGAALLHYHLSPGPAVPVPAGDIWHRSCPSWPGQGWRCCSGLCPRLPPRRDRSLPHRAQGFNPPGERTGPVRRNGQRRPEPLVPKAKS